MPEHAHAHTQTYIWYPNQITHTQTHTELCYLKISSSQGETLALKYIIFYSLLVSVTQKAIWKHYNRDTSHYSGV